MACYVSSVGTSQMPLPYCQGIYLSSPLNRDHLRFWCTRGFLLLFGSLLPTNFCNRSWPTARDSYPLPFSRVAGTKVADSEPRTGVELVLVPVVGHHRLSTILFFFFFSFGIWSKRLSLSK